MSRNRLCIILFSIFFKSKKLGMDFFLKLFFFGKTDKQIRTIFFRADRIGSVSGSDRVALDRGRVGFGSERIGFGSDQVSIGSGSDRYRVG